MTAYSAITDAEINPDKVAKSSTMYKLRDNLSAVVEGDATAPSINPAVLLVGGKGTDGIFNDASGLTGVGYYEFSSMAITAAKALPLCTIIRIAGDSTLSAALTVATRATTVINRDAEDGLLRWMGAVFGNQFNANKYGGASVGACSAYAFSAARPETRAPRSPRYFTHLYRVFRLSEAAAAME